MHITEEGTDIEPIQKAFDIHVKYSSDFFLKNHGDNLHANLKKHLSDWTFEPWKSK